MPTGTKTLGRLLFISRRAHLRELKALGISIYFEKENIDTGEMTSEMMVALYSVFAQAESESTSNNVKLGNLRNLSAVAFKLSFHINKITDF